MRPAPSTAPMRCKLRNQRDLRDAMFFARLNVRELAEICGIRHRSTISHLHSGTRNSCDVYLGRRIEEALRMHPGALFTPVSRTVNVDMPPFPPPPARPRKKVAA